MLPRQALIYSCCATQHDDNLMVLVIITLVLHIRWCHMLKPYLGKLFLKVTRCGPGP